MSLESILELAVESAKAPGAVLYVGDRDHTYVHQAAGDRQLLPSRIETHKDTHYDLASLTKVVATTTAILQLRDRGILSLSDSITDYIPIRAFETITLLHLFTHTSGLVPVERYFESMHSMEEMLHHYGRDGIEREIDIEHAYSDVGFMLLGKVVELAGRMPLDRYCAENIFEPLGMHRTGYNPPEAWKKNCAATENDPWRRKVVLGEVHDENSWAIGGVSGHAGLFSTAEDLAIFCRALLGGDLLKSDTASEMIAFGTKPLYPWQGLGWQVDPWATKKIGFLPSRRAFGHTGWTGTSLWLDPDKELFCILLSNTCHPDRKSRDNEMLRRVVHTAVAKEFYTTTNAHSGLDRLIRENFGRINGKRIALLTNHAAVDQSGRHILDVLPDARELNLVQLYSPEHGIRGQAEAGEKISGQESAIPVVSLYGNRAEPSREELSGIDLFVVDLQDIGARYYTYMATMRRCMETCARLKVPILVLDRPNPLGGITMEGPIAENTDSLVSCTAIPIRHGMTMGELATWFVQNELKDRNVKLTINYLDNWQPHRLFPECSLPWKAPSPNMSTPETALLYIGMCLIEGTNLNEGRGTETPFAILGAPWLDADAVVGDMGEDDLPGLSLSAVSYTPRSIPGKSANPKFRDVACRGIRVTVTDAKNVCAFRMVIAVLQSTRMRHPDDFDFIPFFDTLAGGPDLRTRIEAGESTESIIERYDEQHTAFEEIRPRLYDDDGIPYEFIEAHAHQHP